jgi:hypothetical protein
MAAFKKKVEECVQFERDGNRHTTYRAAGTVDGSTPKETYTFTFFACLYCRRPPPPKLRVCSACRAASYCDDACQRADWPAHKEECGKETARLAFTRQMTHYVSKHKRSLPLPVMPTVEKMIAIFICMDGFATVDPLVEPMQRVGIMEEYMLCHYPYDSLVGRRVQVITSKGTLSFTVFVMPWDGVAGNRIDRAIAMQRDELAGNRVDRAIAQKTARSVNEEEIEGSLRLKLDDLGNVVTKDEMEQINKQLLHMGIEVSCRRMAIRARIKKFEEV